MHGGDDRGPRRAGNAGGASESEEARAEAQAVRTSYAVVAPRADFSDADAKAQGLLFSGIGAISGGGATSRLLYSYPPQQRDEVLDVLFNVPSAPAGARPESAGDSTLSRPRRGAGAALHMLKVEIGGDAQSTDGSEPSHAHTVTEMGQLTHANFGRGYEWWLMREAKRRNPAIKLYGLPWAFPGWLASNTSDATEGNDVAYPSGDQRVYANPERLAAYVYSWVVGAYKYHNLTIDYVGGWNERMWNAQYYKVLRKALDGNELTRHVEIIGSDGSWGATANKLVGAVGADAELKGSMGAIGVHYPGATSPTAARAAGVPLWASEDDSTFADLEGGGCLARAINRNFVDAGMTCTIVWNLIGSYYSGFPFFSSGLMDAAQPWTGSYNLRSPIWMAAHTTQFTRPGWIYLPVGQGSGKLTHGGSYVTMREPESGDGVAANWAMVIEKMSAYHSSCVRPSLGWYDTAPEVATFKFVFDADSLNMRGVGGAPRREDSDEHATDASDGCAEPTLGVWRSCLGFDYPASSKRGGGERDMFERLPDVAVCEGEILLEIETDCVYTVAPLDSFEGAQGRIDLPETRPEAKPFPLPYTSVAFASDDADPENDEGVGRIFGDQTQYFADQAGTFEVRHDWHSAPAEDSAGGDPIPGASNFPKGNRTALVQVVPERPVTWSGDLVPFSLVGDAMWQDVSVSATVSLGGEVTRGGGAFVAARVDGRGTFNGVRPVGIYFVLEAGGDWRLEPSLQSVHDRSATVASGVVPSLSPQHAHDVRLTLVVSGDTASAYLSGRTSVRKVRARVRFLRLFVHTGRLRIAHIHTLRRVHAYEHAHGRADRLPNARTPARIHARARTVVGCTLHARADVTCAQVLTAQSGMNAIATHGFCAIGTTDYLRAGFKDFAVRGVLDPSAGALSAGGAAPPAAGTPLSAQPCGNDLLHAAGVLAWTLSGGRLTLRSTLAPDSSTPPLCAGVGSDRLMRLVPCDSPQALDDVVLRAYEGTISASVPSGMGAAAGSRACIALADNGEFDKRMLNDAQLVFAPCPSSAAGEPQPREANAKHNGWVYDYEAGSVRFNGGWQAHCMGAYAPMRPPQQGAAAQAA